MWNGKFGYCFGFHVMYCDFELSFERIEFCKHGETQVWCRVIIFGQHGISPMLIPKFLVCKSATTPTPNMVNYLQFKGERKDRRTTPLATPLIRSSFFSYSSLY